MKGFPIKWTIDFKPAKIIHKLPDRISQKIWQLFF
ncbi:hypothetical protein AYI68_g6558, partial [Smittium mucronatum]